MKCVLHLAIFCVLLIAIQGVPFGPRYANYAQTNYPGSQYSTQYDQNPYGGSQYPNANQQTRPGNQGTFGSYNNNYQQPYNQYNQTRPGNQGAFGGTGVNQYQPGSQPIDSLYNSPLAPLPGSTGPQGPYVNPYNQSRPYGTSGVGGTYPGSGGSYPASGSGQSYPGATGNYPASGGNYPSATGIYPSIGGTNPTGIGSNYPSGTTTRYPPYGGSSYPSAYNTTYPSRPGGNYPSNTGTNYPSGTGISQPPYGGSAPHQTPVGQQSQQFLNCLSRCDRSQESSPVCGSNRQTYPNLKALQCEQTCGAGVTYGHHGSC